MIKEQYDKLLESLIKNVHNGDSQAVEQIINLENNKYKLINKDEIKDLVKEMNKSLLR